MSNSATPPLMGPLDFYYIRGYPAYYRVSAGSSIKYLEVLNTKTGFPYHDIQQVPRDQLPEGDWKVAQLVHDDTDDKLIVASVGRKVLPDVMEAWSGIKVDYESLGDWLIATEGEALQLDHYMICSGLFSGPAEVRVPRVLTFVEPWYHFSSALASENNIQQLIRDTGISARLIGHLTEKGGRVIGFMLEPAVVRQAGIEHLEDCKAVLRKLHKLGIAHGCLHRSSFLILEDGSGALLQGFHDWFKTEDQEVLDREMADVERVLQQPQTDEQPGV